MSGIACPSCDHTDHRVFDSRPDVQMGVGVIKRRRACKKCQHRFSTFELDADKVADLVEAALREWGDE